MIAVTGGAGFIGSNLVDELMVQGHEVRVLDDFSEGKPENLANWARHERLEVVRGDVRDYDTVRRTVDGCSIVYHLAGMSRIQPSITDPLAAFTANYVGTANLAEACRQGGIKRLVYSASSSAYGRKNDWATNPAAPKQPDDWSNDYGYNPPSPSKLRDHAGARPDEHGRFRWGLGGLVEDLPTECLNPYSLAKKGGEEILELYRILYGLSTVSLRYFNVYGPRHQEEGSYATVIAIFRKQLRQNRPLTIVGTGEQRRDFTFVGDVVRANMLAGMNRDVTGVVNIGAGQNYSINELASLIAPGHPIEFIAPRLGEANVTLANTMKAQELLGWRSQITLQQGLEVLDMYERKFGNPGGIIL